ncbi:MAG TPA: hypothetical protein VNI52_14090 [Sphingobacteriaceae bacterium]|nr:hypothetical protein [Sphingobacteriaceae bacterium]
MMGKTISGKVISFRNICIAFLLTGLLSFNTAETVESVLQSYKADELKYFSEVAFLSGKTRRWGESIRISQVGCATKDIVYMGDLINELQPLLSRVPITYVTSGGNLIIHYTKTISDFSQKYTGKGILPLGYAIPKFSSDNSLIHADIYLHPSLLSAKKNEVLIHEICHTLGLLDHPSSPFTADNIMGASAYKNKSSFLTIPRLDKAALNLLYDDRMPKNLKKEDFLKKWSLLSTIRKIY